MYLDIPASDLYVRECRSRLTEWEHSVADLKARLAFRVPFEQWGIDRQRFDAQVEQDYDHQAKMAQLACQVLILHTRHDGLVPSWNSEILARWAGERLFRLVLFDVGDHNSIQLFNADSYRANLADFIAATTDDAG